MMEHQNQVAKLSNISAEMVATISADIAAARLMHPMMKLWDRAEQTLAGLLGLAALGLALWQVASRYFFPRRRSASPRR